MIIAHLQGEDGTGPNVMPSGGGGFEFGVDPNEDPELALALRVSMEEQRARQQERTDLKRALTKPNYGICHPFLSEILNFAKLFRKRSIESISTKGRVRWWCRWRGGGGGRGRRRRHPDLGGSRCRSGRLRSQLRRGPTSGEDGG